MNNNTLWTKEDQEAEDNIDKLLTIAFPTEHPALMNWIRIKFVLKKLKNIINMTSIENPVKLDPDLFKIEIVDMNKGEK